VTRRRDTDDEADDRPPICPACGVTMGMVVTDDQPIFVCLECGFSDSAPAVD
jgi:Zn ribbon nucleic-acid-binding protein